LTDENLSFTGYEDDYIKNKAIELSKQLQQEVKKILHDNKHDIKEIASAVMMEKSLNVKNYNVRHRNNYKSEQ
jgi:hypothetical protein